MAIVSTAANDPTGSSPGLERARAYVAACVERGEIGGAVVVVSRHDQVAQMTCAGLRDMRCVGRPRRCSEGDLTKTHVALPSGTAGSPEGPPSGRGFGARTAWPSRPLSR